MVHLLELTEARGLQPIDFAEGAGFRRMSCHRQAILSLLFNAKAVRGPGVIKRRYVLPYRSISA